MEGTVLERGEERIEFSKVYLTSELHWLQCLCSPREFLLKGQRWKFDFKLH